MPVWEKTMVLSVYIGAQCSPRVTYTEMSSAMSEKIPSGREDNAL